MNDFDGMDWQDIAFLSGMAEDIANEELEIEKARRDTFGENDPFTDTDDENIDTDFDDEDESLSTDGDEDEL
jgi:U3 small nucleolar ribonucleoprotein component